MKTRLNNIESRLNEYSQSAHLNQTQIAIVSALQEAVAAGLQGNYPVGSVITDSKLNILSRGRNSVFKPSFRSEAHAEMNAITAYEALEMNSSDASATLISTLEPCLMCASRILLSKISKVIFLHSDKAAGVCDRLHLLPKQFLDLSQRVRFREYSEDTAFKDIAKELYNIGEELWIREYC